MLFKLQKSFSNFTEAGCLVDVLLTWKKKETRSGKSNSQRSSLNAVQIAAGRTERKKNTDVYSGFVFEGCYFATIFD